MSPRLAIIIAAAACAVLLALAPAPAFHARSAPGVAYADTAAPTAPAAPTTKPARRPRPDTTASARADSAVETFLAYDEPPRVIKIFAPEYPSEAKRARIEGTVDVRMTISERGRVIDAVVHRSDTIPLLEQAALKAAKISLFRPALAGGKPVKARIVFPFPFKVAQ